ncbi:unnamed protein product [Musa acuminata var. zebrina]
MKRGVVVVVVAVLSCFASFPLFGLSDSAISLVSRSSSLLAAYHCLQLSSIFNRIARFHTNII